jgi:hypothetical protein
MIMLDERVGGSVNANLPAQNFKLPSPFQAGYFKVGSVMIQIACDNVVILRHDKRCLDNCLCKLIKLG